MERRCSRVLSRYADVYFTGKKKYYGTTSVHPQRRFTQRVGRMLALSDEKLQLTTENFWDFDRHSACQLSGSGKEWKRKQPVPRAKAVSLLLPPCLYRAQC